MSSYSACSNKLFTSLYKFVRSGPFFSFLEQIIISASNFLFVILAGHLSGSGSQEIVLYVYTLCIGIFPLYFALISLPFGQAILRIKPPKSYICLLLFSLSITASLFAFAWLKLSGFSAPNFDSLELILFVITYYMADFARRLWIASLPIKAIFIVISLLLFVPRVSAVLSFDFELFLRLNIISSFIYSLVLLALLFYGPTQYSIAKGHATSRQAFLTDACSIHFNVIKRTFLSGIFGFITISPVLFWASTLPADFFRFFTRVRSFAAVFNPIFEYSDIFLSLSPSLNTRAVSSLLRRSALSILLPGVLLVGIISFGILFSPNIFIDLFQIQLFTANVPYYALCFLCLGLGTLFSYSNRLFFASNRRSGNYRSELYVIAFSSMVIVPFWFLPKSLLYVALCFALISFLQFILHLFFARAS